MIHRSVLLFVFFASGFAALVYQIIWQRLLTLVTGSDVQSVTLIVSAIMVGLGIGSVAGGHLADRLTNRARLLGFAACELAIAIFGAVSVPLFYDVLYRSFSASHLSPVAAAALHLGATLWPTMFMGMSFPLIARAITSDPRHPARFVPIAYGWNTLGAAAGAVVTASVLMPMMPFQSIAATAAIISAICGAAVGVMAMRLPRLAADAAPVERAADPSVEQPSLRLWIVLFAISGFVALSLEIVWFRMLSVMLKADATTFGRLLALYLGGVGLGALAAQSARVRRWPAAQSFLVLQAIVPIYSGLAIAVFGVAVARVPIVDRISPYLAGANGLSPDAAFSMGGLLIGWGIPIVLMTVPTFLIGLSFGKLHQVVHVELHSLGRRIGWLQAANITGAVIGAVLTGFRLTDAVPSVSTMRILVVLGGFFLWLAIARHVRFDRRRLLAGAAATVAVALVALPDRSLFWARMHGADRTNSIVAIDRSGVALLRQTDTGFAVNVNGKGQSALPFRGVQTDLGLVPSMLHPDPERIAIIGLGSGNTAFSAGGRRETTRIDAIEIVAPLLTALREAAATGSYPALDQLLRDPRVQFSFTDGRKFLSNSRERYDIIEADALQPESAYAGNLYSVEYFLMVRGRLRAGGLAVTWVPTLRVRESLREAFPHVLIWGELAVASERPIIVERDAILARLNDPFTQSYFRAAGIDAGAIINTYLTGAPDVFTPADARPRRVDLNRDLFPRDEFRTQN